MPSSTTPTSSSVAVRAKDKVESPGSYTMGDFTPDSSQGPATPSRPRSEKEVQLDYRRTRGEISCAECRRYVNFHIYQCILLIPHDMKPET